MIILSDFQVISDPKIAHPGQSETTLCYLFLLRIPNCSLEATVLSNIFDNND